MKRNLDTGVEVCDNRVKKNQRHTTNEKPNMYKDKYNIIIKDLLCGFLLYLRPIARVVGAAAALSPKTVMFLIKFKP